MGCPGVDRGRYVAGRVRGSAGERPLVHPSELRILSRDWGQDQVPTRILGQGHLVRSARDSVGAVSHGAPRTARVTYREGAGWLGGPHGVRSAAEEERNDGLSRDSRFSAVGRPGPPGNRAPRRAGGGKG